MNSEYHKANSITHLWNVSSFLEKMGNPEAAKLRLHYLRCCKELGNGTSLPRQNFGPGVLCPKCGSSWATTKHKALITPGKTPPNRIENLIRVFKDSDSNLPRCRRTLARKCEKNRSNKLTRICSVCLETSNMFLRKPKRLKIPKSNPLNNSDLKLSSKKKKKRVKDRSAGLNISGSKTPDTSFVEDSPRTKHSKTPLLNNIKLHSKKKIPLSVSKPQKINLSKLKGIINTNVTPSKKSKLHTFLQELC